MKRLPYSLSEILGKSEKGHLDECDDKRTGFEQEASELTEFMVERLSCLKTTKEMNLIKLRENSSLKDKAAQWFSQKWNISFEEYMESITQCIEKKSGVPQWYVILNDSQDIIAGVGIIQNDFHNRKDLSPNLCALFVEQSYRNHGIARQILDFVRKDMYSLGIEKLYLVTDHTEFYEKCGWSFLTMVHDMEGIMERMYMAETKEV